MADTDQKETSQTTPTIVSMTSDRIWSNNQPLLIGIAVVVVLVSGVLGYHHWHKATPTPQQITVAENSADYKQAITFIKRALPKAATPTKKASLYVELGNNYVNNGQINQAISAYKSAADATSMSANLAYLLASDYQRTSQRQQAITYYKLAIKLWPKDDPLYSAQTNDFQQNINFLQGEKTQ